MKKIYLLAFFLTIVNSNAQTNPCSPWPWCIQELEPITVPGPWRPPTGPPPPYNTPAPPITVPNIPSPKVPCPGTPMKDMKVAPSGGWSINGGTYGYTRSKGKQFHDGIDIAGEIGSNLYNMYQGIVTRVENSFAPGQYGSGKDGYGNYVQVESTLNGETFTLKYNHLNSVANIKVGDRISQGQTIGTLGNTGNAASEDVPIIPHVHIQAKDKNGKRTNPDKYLNGEINKRNGNITANCK